VANCHLKLRGRVPRGSRLTYGVKSRGDVRPLAKHRVKSRGDMRILRP